MHVDWGFSLRFWTADRTRTRRPGEMARWREVRFEQVVDHHRSTIEHYGNIDPAIAEHGLGRQRFEPTTQKG